MQYCKLLLFHCGREDLTKHNFYLGSPYLLDTGREAQLRQLNLEQLYVRQVPGTHRSVFRIVDRLNKVHTAPINSRLLVTQTAKRCLDVLD